MLKFIKKNWVIFIVLAICFWAVKALFVPGFFPIHDDEQIARIFELNSALSDGQFPVRWVSHLGFGFGYPLFNFYPPLTYYCGAIFHLIGFSFIDSTKLIFLFSFLIASVFMYLWTKDHFGKLAGIFSAILYTYAPYHAVNIYVRGSLPDFFAYALFPIVFWVLDRLFKTKKLLYFFILIFLLAFIPLAHILNIISFTPFFIIYLSYLLIQNKKEINKILPLILISIILAFGLCAFFILPAFFEKNYTLVDKINTGELYSYKLHFVYLRQLISSPWGYGGSIFGLLDGLSFEIGKIHLLVSAISVFLIIFLFAKKKISELKFAALALFMFLLAVYLTSFYSEWIWNKTPPLAYLQFPWRFLTYASLFSSLLGGFLIYMAQKYFGKKLALILFFLLGIAAIFINISYFQPQKYLNVNDSYYTNLDDIKWRVSKASFEFVPKGVATKLSDINTTQIDLEKKDISSQPFKIIGGDADIKILSDKSNYKEFSIETKSSVTFQVNTFSFPGWITEIDGKKIKYRDNNKLKLITLDIPKGKHDIIVRLTNTMPRAVGNAISLIVLVNLIGLGLFKLWKK